MKKSLQFQYFLGCLIALKFTNLVC